MGRPKTVLSKAELAAVLKLSKGRVTQLIAKGLPVRSDGKVDRNAAVGWYHDNVRESMAKRGPKAKVQAMPAAVAPEPGAAEDLADDAPPEINYGARAVYEALIANSARVPEILCELGCRDPAVLAVSAEVFCDLVFSLAWDENDIAYDWGANDDRSPTPAVDLRKLAEKYSFEFDPEAVKTDYQTGREPSAAEQIINRLDTLLWT
jgi:hypothetical protein